MKKNVFGRQFKRDANERKALFKGLLSSLVIYEKIKTTEAKAKAIRGQMEKLVTKARKERNNTAGFDRFLTPPATRKLIADIAPRFTNRPGGYTRIVKLGRRMSDHASMAVMEWVEGSSKLKVQSEKLKKPAKKVQNRDVVEAEIVAEKPKKEKKETRSANSGQIKETKGKNERKGKRVKSRSAISGSARKA